MDINMIDEKKGPCWDGYEMVGMKMKNGKEVPNCVPIKEEYITEAPWGAALGWAVTGWIKTMHDLVQSGTLTPVQATVVGFGVPAIAADLVSKDFGMEYIQKAKQFVKDYKDGKKLTPQAVDDVVSASSEVIKTMPKGKQKHAAKLIRATKAAMEAGDKKALLKATRDIKAYANKEIDSQNQQIDKLHKATSKKSVSAAEKQIAPQGAKHVGWGRWTDASGKTLGYTRDGKWVPAQQKIQENSDDIYDGEFCPACLVEYIKEHANLMMEADYQGRKVPLGKPMQGDVKKFKVYVKDPKTGNVKKVNFGDKSMRIKKSNPKRKKSFRARHNCDSPGPRTKARYWSCRKW
jgi:hypothetical protein